MADTHTREDRGWFWDTELTTLADAVSAIYGEAATHRAIGRVPLPPHDRTLANIVAYRRAVKAELRRMVRPQ